MRREVLESICNVKTVDRGAGLRVFILIYARVLDRLGKCWEYGLGAGGGEDKGRSGKDG